MFDIGFTELVLIGVVALLVIGPERLPETIRTASVWLNRLRRGFNEIKQEVQQELHNDAVLRDLRKTGEQLKQDIGALGEDLKGTPTAPRTSTQEPARSSEADLSSDASSTNSSGKSPENLTDNSPADKRPE